MTKHSALVETVKPGEFWSFEIVSNYAGNASRSTLWRWVKDGEFPAPRKIGRNRAAWLASEVIEWSSLKAKGKNWGEPLETQQSTANTQ